MSMLSERLQILVSPEQRRRLEAEAKRLRSSVGALVREAIEERYGTTSAEDRLRAVEEIAALKGRFLSPDDLEQVIAEEREAAGQG
jgi:predicted transcriptional regulator